MFKDAPNAWERYQRPLWVQASRKYIHQVGQWAKTNNLTTIRAFVSQSRAGRLGGTILAQEIDMLSTYGVRVEQVIIPPVPSP
jgi:hypothetical protein